MLLLLDLHQTQLVELFGFFRFALQDAVGAVEVLRFCRQLFVGLPQLFYFIDVLLLK